MVSIMHANNEIGTIQPLREISDICREREVLVHTDAAQSVGKVRVKVDELGVDLLSIAGHKLYAPKGIGALYVGQDVDLTPVMHGAGQEKGLRAGTENVPYIVALGAAALEVAQDLDMQSTRLILLRDRLYDHLRSIIGTSLSANGHGGSRLPNTLSINFPDVVGAELLERIPEICARPARRATAPERRCPAPYALSDCLPTWRRARSGSAWDATAPTTKSKTQPATYSEPGRRCTERPGQEMATPSADDTEGCWPYSSLLPPRRCIRGPASRQTHADR